MNHERAILGWVEMVPSHCAQILSFERSMQSVVVEFGAKLRRYLPTKEKGEEKNNATVLKHSFFFKSIKTLIFLQSSPCSV